MELLKFGVIIAEVTWHRHCQQSIHTMTLNLSSGVALTAALGLTLSACGERGGMSPTSPSVVSSLQTREAQRSASPLVRKGIDSDGDGYDDGDSGMPPDAGMYPEGIPPAGFPPPEGLPPAPLQLTIGIVGLIGPLSFVPNPLQAAIGNTIVWTNNDVLQHDIVLDDGTPVGNLAPGQSSTPISLTTENASFHCTLHPSMTGQITPISIVVDGLPVPPDGSQPPMPDPSYTPSPDPYSYDDGYEDDYY